MNHLQTQNYTGLPWLTPPCHVTNWQQYSSSPHLVDQMRITKTDFSHPYKEKVSKIGAVQK